MSRENSGAVEITNQSIFNRSGLAGPLYGCHSNTNPDKFKRRVLTHSSGKVSWPDPLTNSCQYDQRAKEIRCDHCTH